LLLEILELGESRKRRPSMPYQSFFTKLILLCLVTLPALGQKIIVTGFETPESVVHDALADVYLVSNVGAGDPGALDHNGFISRVSPTGTILQLKWIQDGVNGAVLNGPKGLALHDGTLYVADVDTLRIFNRFTGAPIASIAIPNPFGANQVFLNDVAVSDNGTVFISDNANGGLFKVDPQGHAAVLSIDPSLNFPNGLVADGTNSAMWVTWIGNQIMRINGAGNTRTGCFFTRTSAEHIAAGWICHATGRLVPGLKLGNRERVSHQCRRARPECGGTVCFVLR
jgi:sugar lactone lactonase YvrE